MADILSRFPAPLAEFGTGAQTWREGFANKMAGMIARGETLPSGSFEAREGGKAIADLTVIPIQGQGWSILWTQRSSFGGREWISQRYPDRMDDWIQDSALTTLPAGSLVEVGVAAELIGAFLEDPAGVPDGSHWADSTALNWPERV